MERTVKVWSDNCRVSVYQQSKSVWIAAGEYMGHHFQVKDRTEGAALKRWADAARYRGN